MTYSIIFKSLSSGTAYLVLILETSQSHYIILMLFIVLFEIIIKYGYIPINQFKILGRKQILYLVVSGPRESLTSILFWVRIARRPKNHAQNHF